MRLRLPSSGIRLLVGVALIPVLVLWIYGGVMVMPPLWVHFYGVGVSALAAAAAALTLMTMGARRGDARTVVVAGGFTIMAALLAVHGLVTPGVIVGQNGVIALTGATTLPIGAAVLALSGLAVFNGRRSIPFLLWLVGSSWWRSWPSVPSAFWCHGWFRPSRTHARPPPGRFSWSDWRFSERWRFAQRTRSSSPAARQISRSWRGSYCSRARSTLP